MKRYGWLALVLGVGIGFATTPVSMTVTAAESADSYANETPQERDARMQWWREARFGMFIHWGVYAVPAGTYQDRRINGIGEWIMHNAKIPVETYRSYSRDFTAARYDADEWVRLAKEAGMKYIIITTKHHDGFALFDTRASDWNVVQSSPYGRDLIKPLADACRRHGIRLGFYYSQAQDWVNGGSAAGGKWDPAQERSMDDYIDRVAVPQMRELLSNYGEFPAVLWWDTPIDMNRERAEKLIALLKLRPGIIHNNRLGGGFLGDTETPEQYIPSTGFRDRDWETCMTINDTWGFKSYDHDWKSTETLVRNLVDIASKGGNYLLNVGPTADGVIPAASVERLKEVGAWMKANGEAIYATTASPFRRLSWGRCTTCRAGEETILYLHVFDWPKDGRLTVRGLKNDVVSARLLVNGGSVKWKRIDSEVELELPADAPDRISSTVVLRIKGAPDVEPMVVAQNADGSIRLNAADAELEGREVRYEADKDCLGYWTRAGDVVAWEVGLNRSGRYRVEMEIASTASSQFEIVAADGVSLRGTVPNTGGYEAFKRIELPETVELSKPGQLRFRVKPVANDWKPINLKSVTLTPVSQ